MNIQSVDDEPGARPYETIVFSENPYIAKRQVIGTLVAVVRFKSEQRGLKLIPPYSRCVQNGEVHELAITDEITAVPGSIVQRAAFLGFVEFSSGGVLLLSDQVLINNHSIGQICGFDLTHAPNHMNIVLRGLHLKTGEELGLEVGDKVVFDFDVTAPWPKL